MSGSFFRLVALNAWRHRLRSGLTVLGMVVAILAFGLLGTVVDAWYAGANGAAANRLITRSSISLVFPLPLTYKDRIRAVDGVRDLSWANWFGGIYKEPKNFFPQFAVDGESYFRIYPEFIVDERQMRDFLRDRKGCIVGRKLADTHGFKVGDTLTLKGTIYAGNWDFVIRGIYDGASKSTDRSQMFFHWAYLNETVKARLPARADNVGVLIVEVDSADRVATMSRSIDREFVNSRAETLTETEKAFALRWTGDICTLPELLEVAKRHGARVLIDEPHSTFLFGQNGRGVAEHFGLDEEVDFHLGTFSKSLGGQGGFVAGSRKLVDYINAFGRSRFFSCNLSPVLVAGLLAGIKIVQKEPELRQKLWSNVAFLRRRFAEECVDLGKSNSQVMPVMVNNDARVFAVAEKIQDRGLFLQPVTYPAVPKHKSRLRISVSAAHTEADLETAVRVIASVLREEGVCQ